MCKRTLILLEKVTFRLIPKGQAPLNLLSSKTVFRGLPVLNKHGGDNGLYGSYYDHYCSFVNIIIAYDCLQYLIKMNSFEVSLLIPIYVSCRIKKVGKAEEYLILLK